MRKTKLILVTIIAVLLAGCWDKIEMEDKAFVLALGIDLDGEFYNFTYAVGNQSEPSGEEESSTTAEAGDLTKIKATTLSKACETYMRKSPRQPNFEHLKIIIIGEALFDNPKMLDKLLLEFEQNYEIARTVLVFTTDGEANKIIGLEKNITGPIGLYIRKIIENNSEIIGVKAVRLDQLLSAIGEEGVGAVEVPKIYEEEEKPIVK